jgi:hypothetical protein
MYVLCVLCVFLHATVACGTELLDVLGIKICVATLVQESTYLRSSHGSRRRSASRYLPRTCVRDTHYYNA